MTIKADQDVHDQLRQDRDRRDRKVLLRKLDRDQARQARELVQRWSNVDIDPRPIDEPTYKP